MNRHVNAISDRLSLRPPQRRSLEILDRVTEIAPIGKGANLAAALEAIRGEFPEVTDFERDFPSLCFALATGVGKTRLMGAFVSYLHLAHGINNFFVLAPNLTIYNKLIADFTPNTGKYVFKGIMEFTTEAPRVITGDNYEFARGRPEVLPGMSARVTINIFNISKINSEVRGGKAPRIKRLSEYIGESYFDYLAGLPDLVLLMDESHRYRASAGVRAINELKPILGLELTATPFIETGKGTAEFKNIIYRYQLGEAMADGFVKEPAVVTRKDFNPAGMTRADIDRLKLDDGVRLHENIKVELETYARANFQAIVKPFLLAIARDTTHAGQLLQLIQSDAFFGGHYKDKVIQVDSSQTGAAEDAMVARLLRVEHADEPTEIVIHVNMLKEGWDVTNLYTIVPLRAANARTLIEQSIGRGLRLPYGERTGISAVDRLNIVAHDRFQEIIEEANRPDSTIRIQGVVMGAQDLASKFVTVVSPSILDSLLGIAPGRVGADTIVAGDDLAPAFPTTGERAIAKLTYEAIRELENEPGAVPGVAGLKSPEIQARLAAEVTERYIPVPSADGGLPELDVAAVVAGTIDLAEKYMIDIPRIMVEPTGETKSGFTPFQLDVADLRYAPVSDELWIQHLLTDGRETQAITDAQLDDARLEDSLVRALDEFDDVSYDDHADLLYDLAGQAVKHLRANLSESEARQVLHVHRKDIAGLIHAQMSAHRWEETGGFEVRVYKGFTNLKHSAFKARAGEAALDFRQSPEDKTNMAAYRFGGFKRCLYSVQKFDSDAERKLAVVLDRDALKWIRPVHKQFHIVYKLAGDSSLYRPDFVAETADAIYMLEPKARKELAALDVLAKQAAAIEWCRHASEHTAKSGGLPWRYVLIPDDEIAENMTLEALAERFRCS